MGYEFFPNYFYYLSSPFNIVALLVGIWNMEIGVVMAMFVQIGLCDVTMMYYLRHTSRNKSKTDNKNVWICALFSVTYAMCDYMLAYQYTYIWLISLMLGPLVMLGVERLIEGKGSLFYIVSLLFTLITNFYFAWFICILSVIWYIDCIRIRDRQYIRCTIKYVVCSLHAALASAFVLIPCYFAISGREFLMVKDLDNPLKVFGNITNFLQGFFWGASIDTLGSDLFTNNTYVGIMVIVCLLLYSLNKSIDEYARIKRIIEIILMLVCCNWLAGIYIFHGFTYPNMFCNRQVFILLIIIIVTSFEEMINISKVGKREYIIVLASFFVIYICIHFLEIVKW